ncbi:MAG: DUF362 domain-containing protein [Thermodesulfobacteriota bacterium]
MGIHFREEEVVFHRERYLEHLASMRPKGYPPLLRKDVAARGPWSHRLPNPYMRDGRALVSFVVASTDLKADIAKALELLGGLQECIKPHDRVLLKPNFNSDDPPPGSTALDFLSAVIELLREHGCTRISVGESAGRPWVPTEKVFRNTGLSELMAKLNVPLLDFDRSPYQDVPLETDFWDQVAYPVELQEFDKIIYLPTMKTHFTAGFSMSLKLTVGLVHLFDRMTLHADNNMFVSQRAAQLNLPVKPDLIIMDGRVSFVSGGPAIGLKMHPGVILASGDPVAIDVQGVRLLQNYAAVNHLGGDPWHLPQISTAVELGLGARGDREMLLIRAGRF